MIVKIKTYPLLQIWRESLHLNKKEIAKKLGTYAERYGHYELGRCLPNLKMFVKIADFFVNQGIEGASYEMLAKDMLEYYELHGCPQGSEEEAICKANLNDIIKLHGSQNGT